MDYSRSDSARPRAPHWFPERHIHLRSGDETRDFVLTTRSQILLAILATLVGGWCLFATGSVAWSSLAQASQDDTVARMTAYYERMNADRQARLTAAVSALNRASGSIEGMAKDIEKRHEALAWLLQDFRGTKSSGAELKPVDPASLSSRSPAEQMAAVREDQDRLLTAAESTARNRAERLRVAIRMTGVDPRSLGTPGIATAEAPLARETDPRALAAELNVDEDYAVRVQHAARDVLDFRVLSAEAEHVPMARPVTEAYRSSTYGIRKDPFTGHPAFHAGQDFAGGYGSPVYSTAPGVVAFTGVRTGYGNVVEIDHGSGFKTRYAHLASISVRPGQRIGVGFRVGAMGSTGRSTGPHLHYEVWENGRVRDPTRFLKAGDHVQQAD